MKDEAEPAVFNAPPATTEILPDATLEHPPPIAEYKADAVFAPPPEIVLKFAPLDTVLLQPPLIVENCPHAIFP
jgi:hypothetical protein